MQSLRPVTRVLAGKRTIDGAGVSLTRMFSRNAAADLDPFLLLDLFGSDRPEDYVAGFPMHPHRGIETVTYMLDGHVDHKDSLGNKGTIGPGDVQWMTSGSGIMHEEMPRRSSGWMRGLQLWVNLPRANKMMPPRYRGVDKEEIPLVDLGGGSSVKVVAGEFDGVKGPVDDLVVEAEYLDVQIQAGRSLEHRPPRGLSSFAAIYAGSVRMGGEDGIQVASGETAMLGDGDIVKAVGGKAGARFLLVSGRPLREPIAWGGPIVMNTEKELETAFAELRSNTFIKPKE